MNLKDLMEKLDAIDAGAMIPNTAGGSQDIDTIKKYTDNTSAPAFIDSKDGMVKYMDVASAREAGGTPIPKIMPSDWIQRYAPDLAKALASTGAGEQIKNKFLGMSMDQGTKVDLSKLKTPDVQANKAKVPDAPVADKVAPKGDDYSIKIAQLNDLVGQLEKSGSGAGASKTNTTIDNTTKKLSPVDPKIKALQNAILAIDPKALPKYGADGRMGPETQTAMKDPRFKAVVDKIFGTFDSGSGGNDWGNTAGGAAFGNPNSAKWGAKHGVNQAYQIPKNFGMKDTDANWEESVNISKELIESFGYVAEAANEKWTGSARNWGQAIGGGLGAAGLGALGGATGALAGPAGAAIGAISGGAAGHDIGAKLGKNVADFFTGEKDEPAHASAAPTGSTIPNVSHTPAKPTAPAPTTDNSALIKQIQDLMRDIADNDSEDNDGHSQALSRAQVALDKALGASGLQTGMDQQHLDATSSVKESDELSRWLKIARG